MVNNKDTPFAEGIYHGTVEEIENRVSSFSKRAFVSVRIRLDDGRSIFSTLGWKPDFVVGDRVQFKVEVWEASEGRFFHSARNPKLHNPLWYWADPKIIVDLPRGPTL